MCTLHPQSDAGSRCPGKYAAQSRAAAVVEATLQHGEKVLSGLRTSRLGAGHNGSTARFTQGLAALSWEEQTSHTFPGTQKGRPVLPWTCRLLCAWCSRPSIAAWHCSALYSAGHVGLGLGKGWRGSNLLLLLARCTCLGIGDQGKRGALPASEEPNACALWPCYLLLPQASKDLYESGGEQLRPCTGAPAPFKGALLVLRCIVHKTQGTEMNLLPLPTIGSGRAVMGSACAGGGVGIRPSSAATHALPGRSLTVYGHICLSVSLSVGGESSD